MGKKDIIYDLLKKSDLTTAELADKTGLDENQCRTYVNRLKQENLVKNIGKKERYKIYRAVNGEKANMSHRILHDKVDKLGKLNAELKESVKFLMDFFQQNKNVLKEPASEHKDKFKHIIEVFQQ